MARDDKKTSAGPKNVAAEKKEVTAKKDEGRAKEKTTPDADRSKAESGEKAASSPSVYNRGEGQNRFRKHIEITGTQFTRRRKGRNGNGSMEQGIAVSENVAWSRECPGPGWSTFSP
jgi:hypothetical protein